MSLTFLKESLTEQKVVGAITESSNALAEKVISVARLKNAKVVVEFGTGTGIFTEKIMENISQSTLFFALEVNKSFVEKTVERCPQVRIYNESAEAINKYLFLHGKKKCDCIISSLPFGFFNNDMQEKIFDAINTALSPNGQFVTFSYLHAAFVEDGKHFRKLLHRNFSTVQKSDIIWKNIPPAVVYSCLK